MGQASDKEILEVIADPDNEADLRALFAKFDKDKSGALSRDEWLNFGKYLWKVDVDGAHSEMNQVVRPDPKEPRSLGP